jgi:hypothetical protein
MDRADAYAECSFRKVTSIGTWQKTRQKTTAEEYRIVQKIAGRQDKKTPQKTARHGVLAT